MSQASQTIGFPEWPAPRLDEAQVRTRDIGSGITEAWGWDPVLRLWRYVWSTVEEQT